MKLADLRHIIPQPLRTALKPAFHRVFPPPPAFLGYLATSTQSEVSGWVQNLRDPAARVAVEVYCAGASGRRLVASGIANRHDPALAAQGFPDPACGFLLRFVETLSEAEVATIEIWPLTASRPLPPAAPRIHGLIAERRADVVAGWVQLSTQPDASLAVEVVVTGGANPRVVARGIANRRDEKLAAQGHRHPACGFRIDIAPPLDEAELPHLVVRTLDGAAELPFVVAPLIGYVRERTARHVAGWTRTPADPNARVAVEVVSTRPGAERVIARGIADRYDRVLAALGIGDALHGFRVIFSAPVDASDLPFIAVRAAASSIVIPEAPDVQTEWRPLRYVAMDIVDNCNLRCPFCLFDHAPVHRTNVMTDETFEAAIRLLPYVGVEGHWMSCLHEPSMHPNLTGFLRKIPREHAHVMTYTTNLAKRMPDAYFATLADSGLSNINVSIESRDPAIYERMRKGARFRIFMENWDKLLTAFAKGVAPPPLRYIAMAYKSNYREIPELIDYLRNERNAWKVEIRDTYDVAHIPPEFRAAEFLEPAEWRWLRDALAQYSPHEVVLVLPPGLDAPEPGPVTAASPVAAEPPVSAAGQANDAPGMIEARIFHDGNMIISTSPDGNYPNYGTELARLNIRDIIDPAAFLMEMSERTMR